MAAKNQQHTAEIIKSSIRKASNDLVLVYELLKERFEDTLAGKRKEPLTSEEFSQVANYVKAEASKFPGVCQKKRCKVK